MAETERKSREEERMEKRSQDLQVQIQPSLTVHTVVTPDQPRHRRRSRETRPDGQCHDTRDGGHDRHEINNTCMTDHTVVTNCMRSQNGEDGSNVSTHRSGRSSPIDDHRQERHPKLSHSQTVTKNHMCTDHADNGKPISPHRPRSNSPTYADHSQYPNGTNGKFVEKITSALGHFDLDHCDPDVCISFLRNPSIKTYAALKRKLKNADKDWIQGFLDADGLEILLSAIDLVGGRRVSQLSDAMLLLECVSCIKELMNSKVGLEYLIQHTDSADKLVNASDTSNIMVKKQVFKLLAAISIYSSKGNKLVLDAFKKHKKQRYRFSLLVNELKLSEVTSYSATLMAFINCLIVSSDDIQERVRIRNEFVGNSKGIYIVLYTRWCH
ncbi:Inverted formin-2, partial [Lamellibrachia satsuma]